MKLRSKLNKIQYDVPVIFKSAISRDGDKVMTFITDTGKKYIVHASIHNFYRFKKWEDAKTEIDFRQFKELELSDKKRYPTARITADVKVKKDIDDSF